MRERERERIWREEWKQAAFLKAQKHVYKYREQVLPKSIDLSYYTLTLERMRGSPANPLSHWNSSENLDCKLLHKYVLPFSTP